jgi:hypothetical protein
MMSKIGRRAIFVLVLVLVGTCIVTGLLIHHKNPAQRGSPTASDPNQDADRIQTSNASWEPSFFLALDERTQKVNLASLRTIALPDQDLEVRFWYDARPDLINGFVIRRSANRWSGIEVRQIRNRQPFEVKTEALPVPKSGWDSAWAKLVAAGILTLPDASELGCNAPSFDTVAYVIETNVDGVYRTYRYSNPMHAECDEAKRIILIEEILGEEFAFDSSQD